MIQARTLKLFQKVAQKVAPPPKLTVSEWADTHRKLSSESSAEPGQWNTDRAPYQKEMMDAVNDPAVETIVVMASSQVGKSEIINNTIGYFIDYDPSPMMLVQPTIDLAQAYSKDRIAPMLRDTPALKNKVKDVKSRDSENTQLHKKFPGGHITLSGANSPASLASRPIRVVLLDEVDRYPASAGTEGDPVSLVSKRTQTFWNRKRIMTSTPTEKGTSRIEVAYEDSTKEKWCLPCPSCGEYQPLTWGQLHFESVTHICKECGTMHDEYDWKAGKGKWIAENPERKKVRGFHLNALSSPWKRWDDIIEEFREAKKGGSEMLKTFVNTILGESWEEEGEQVSQDSLMERCESYQTDVPRGALVLTAGVDVQDNRLEVEVVGWGRGHESWGIDYQVFFGDPGQMALWKQLDDYLGSTFTHEEGHQMRISAACVDSGGHYTSEVYRYCKKRELNRIFAIKGKGGDGIPFVGSFTRNNRERCALFTLGVDEGKTKLMSRLQLDEVGPGYCHFPKKQCYDEQYFRGLTSEKRVLRYRKGKPYYEWKKESGARNEPLDVRNYATAALEIMNPNFDKLKMEKERYQQQRSHSTNSKQKGKKGNPYVKKSNIW